MTDAILTFGVVAVAAAIVGGGLTALGITIPALGIPVRQIGLGIFGMVLIVSAEGNRIWDAILPWMFPQVTENKGPMTLEPGQKRSFPLLQRRKGAVIMSLRALTLKNGQPTQAELYVSICPSDAGQADSCSNRQMGPSESLSRELPAGQGTISIFNFDSNPDLKVTFSLQHPE